MDGEKLVVLASLLLRGSARDQAGRGGGEKLVVLASLLLSSLGCKQTETQPSDLDLSPGPGGTIHCSSSADCPKSLPMCHIDSHVCVGCLANFQTCGAKMTCDDATHTCIPADPNAKCVRNADCPRPGLDPSASVICDRDAGDCTACVTNSDCVPPDVCIRRQNMCGDGCLLCLPGQTCVRATQFCIDGGSTSDGG